MITGGCIPGAHFYLLLAPLLFTGRLLGFPVPDKFGNVSNSRLIRNIELSYSVFMTFCIFTGIPLKLVKWTESQRDLDDVWQISHIFSQFVLYAYLLLKREKLSILLKGYRKPDCGIPVLNDKRRFYFVCASLFLIFSTAFVETMLYDFELREGLVASEETFLEKYHATTLYFFAGYSGASILRHPVYLAVVYIVSKLVTLATDYSDVLSILLTFGVASSVRSLNELLRQRLLLENAQKEKVMLGKGKGVPLEESSSDFTWSSFYSDTVNLRELADRTSRFISPLLLTSLILNVFNVVVTLNSLISPLDKFGRRHGSFYNILSFWHFIMRAILLIHYVSDVYRASEETLDLIERVPEARHNWPMERILAMLRRRPIGITFFDAFIITKNHFITLMSFVFTVEILVLQSSTKS